jgi:hypothetical protein
MLTMKQEAVTVIENLPDTVNIDEIINELTRLRPKKQSRSRTAQTPVSFLEAAKEFIGCVEGPEDLSTNKAYFKDFGR